MAKTKKKSGSHPKTTAPTTAKRSGKNVLAGRPVDTDPTKPPDQEAGAAQPGENLEIPGQEPPKKRGKQARLPGTEDPEIQELEGLAEEYKDVLDKRMALTPEESRLKQELLAMMKRYGKKSYLHEGISIKVVAKEETVKVRINKDEEES